LVDTNSDVGRRNPMKKRRSLVLLLALGLSAGVPATALAGGNYCPPKPPPVKKKCNSGRGNGSEGNPAQLIIPSTGSAGIFPTVDCDPGNSGAKNRGGD
jgi:hypothetical protein